MVAVQLKDISKDWDQFSLKHITLDVEEGEYFVILGPTGAGKTLLLDVIAGIYYPFHGNVFIHDENVTNLPPEKRGVGYVFQDYALFPHMTVLENVEFGLVVRKISLSERRKLTTEYLELVGIDHLSHRKPETLSGGEQQRVALARTLVTNPKILLLDEPLSALDTKTQEALRTELKRLHRTLNLTAIHVTHNHIEAFTLADRIGIMRDGKLVEVGTPLEIFGKPKDEFVAEFVGFENIFEGIAKTSEGNTIVEIDKLIDIEVVTEKGGHVKLGIRPEDIVISKVPHKTSARNLFEGKISDFIDLGSMVKLKIDIGKEFTALITKRSFLDMRLTVNQSVYISFKATAVQIFA
ncbi:MAG: tungstate ABC transporter ATP-binding protein WtpC [Promethearchaeota archaeon]